MLLVSIFVRGDPVYWMCVGWLRTAVWGARVICGVRWRVHGMDNLPTAAERTASVILLSKHQSTWETFAYPVLMPHPLAYVFKRELLYIPFFGWAMARLDMVHIDRSKRAEAWNRVAAQGRRGDGARPLDHHVPGARASRAAGRPAIQSGRHAAGRHDRPPGGADRRQFGALLAAQRALLRPGVVDVVIGTPIASTGRQADELMREVEAWIEGQMRRLDPEAYAAA